MFYDLKLRCTRVKFIFDNVFARKEQLWRSIVTMIVDEWNWIRFLTYTHITSSDNVIVQFPYSFLEINLIQPSGLACNTLEGDGIYNCKIGYDDIIYDIKKRNLTINWVSLAREYFCNLIKVCAIRTFR